MKSLYLALILSLSASSVFSAEPETAKSLRKEIAQLKKEQREAAKLAKLRQMRDCLKSGKSAETCKEVAK